LHCDFAINNFRNDLVNVAKVVEDGEGYIFPLAVVNEILTSLGEEEIRLLCRAEIRHAVTGVEHDGPLGEGRVGADLEGLVMAKDAVIMVLDIPASDVVNLLARLGLDIVGHDLHILHLLFAHKVSQEGLDYGLHPPAEHDDGDVVGPAPRVELLEFWVELDVVEQELHALVERQVDAVHISRNVSRKVRAPERVSLLPRMRCSRPKPTLSVMKSFESCSVMVPSKSVKKIAFGEVRRAGRDSDTFWVAMVLVICS